MHDWQKKTETILLFFVFVCEIKKGDNLIQCLFSFILFSLLFKKSCTGVF